MKPVNGELMVVPDATAFAEEGARLFAEAAAAANGRCVMGLAGGSTPRALYERLAREPWRSSIGWPKVDLVLGDERFVAQDDEKSNLHMIRRALVDHLPIAPHLHPVPFEGMTVERSAMAYEAELQTLYGARTFDPARPFFDLCLLGMGEDGHTASLLPGQDELLDEPARWVRPVVKGRPEARITLTRPVLESARTIVFLVSGNGKREMLDRILSGMECHVPAARIDPIGRLVWLVDREAAGHWAN